MTIQHSKLFLVFLLLATTGLAQSLAAQIPDGSQSCSSLLTASSGLSGESARTAIEAASPILQDDNFFACQNICVNDDCSCFFQCWGLAGTGECFCAEYWQCQ